MIFPALYRFAKNRGLLDELDFIEHTIHCVVLLREDGGLSSIVRADIEKVPISKIPSRNSAAIACLGADTLNRVIPDFDPEANDFAKQTQTLFLSQLEAVYRSQSHPGVAAVVQFLQSLRDFNSARQEIGAQLLAKKFKASEWVSFQVENIENQELMPRWQVLREWWQAEQRKRRQETKDDNSMVPCMVTGDLCNPVRTHGTGIKVAPGGLPGGVALVSSDKPAFGSYGFAKSLVSPMSEEAVEGYLRAINWLGDSGNDNYHYRTADTNFLFFSDQPLSERNPGKAIELGTWQELLNQGSETESQTDCEIPVTPVSARNVFVAPHAGHLSAAHADVSQRFYCLSLSGSSARAIVRGWIDEPLPIARTNVEQWFTDLTIQLDRPLFDSKKKPLAGRGELYNHWALWQLAACLQGEGETAKKQLALWREQLWEAALLDQPIPLSLLIVSVSRIQAKGDIAPVRAALIRCILNRLPNREESMKEEFDLNSKSVAFHCGRLFRLLKNIQQVALRGPASKKGAEARSTRSAGINSTVVSKYYAAASANPAAVFGLLLSNARNHLDKIRGEHPGLAGYFEKNLDEIAGDKIVARGGFPRINQPDRQGEFALGFYFEGIRTKQEKPDADLDTEVEEIQENSGEN